MNIRFLGAHNIESQETGCICLLIDDVLAIDAGALTSSLSFAAQRALKAVLLTHRHYDHIRDVPSLAMNFYHSGTSVCVYSTKDVYETLSSYLFDGRLYPNFLERPAENPAVRFTIMEPYSIEQIAGYSVLPVPVNHSVTTVGYQVTSPEGKALFYTADTGPGLEECWQHVSPRVLITEVTLPDRFSEIALEAGHMTPTLLKQEMLTFRKVKGYLPEIVTVHMSPEMEDEIRIQIKDVAETLGTPITIAYEGMQLQV
ncbi:MAG: lactamase [Dehalococcoidia bacterium]|nr:lactamase [Dehalococcoidia bacterium]MBL7165600.1 lactamase [Dehalococcoidales bacterium]